MLDKEGFAGQYDFVYLPIDFHRRGGAAQEMDSSASRTAADPGDSARLKNQGQCAPGARLREILGRSLTTLIQKNDRFDCGNLKT